MVYKVPITSELIKLARNAYREYNVYLDKKKRLSEEKKKK